MLESAFRSVTPELHARQYNGADPEPAGPSGQRGTGVGRALSRLCYKNCYADRERDPMTTGTGRVPVGERLPTLEDVARVAGVSRATVSRVINGIRNVNPELHEVVWNAVEQTGYVPNRAARSLVTRRTGTIALVVSDSETHEDDPFMTQFFSDPFFGRVVGGLMSALRPAGVQLALQLVGTQDARTRLVGDLRQGQADGSVVLSLHPGDTLPQLLAEARLPTIMIGRPASPLPISYVDVANDAGAALAADHLV